MDTQVKDILAKFESLADPSAREGMAHYGINVENAYGGISMPTLRAMAKELGRDHDLALALWDTGMHEARLLAALVDEPQHVTVAQMERWVLDFNSWDLCDQCCGNLFDRTPYSYDKAFEWSAREEEYVKRAGFAMMAYLSIHDKKSPNDRFERFFPLILREAGDDRNYVKKAVNWALRNIGKRNLTLNAKAIRLAQEMAQIDSKAARWNAKDALRELQSEKIQARLRKKES